MAIQEEVQRAIRKRKEAEEEKPLLRLDLGDLVKESNKLVLRLRQYAFYDDVLTIPPNLREDYIGYQSIMQELNRREKVYTSTPVELMKF